MRGTEASAESRILNNIVFDEREACSFEVAESRDLLYQSKEDCDNKKRKVRDEDAKN